MKKQLLIAFVVLTGITAGLQATLQECEDCKIKNCVGISNPSQQLGCEAICNKLDPSRVCDASKQTQNQVLVQVQDQQIYRN